MSVLVNSYIMAEFPWERVIDMGVSYPRIDQANALLVNRRNISRLSQPQKANICFRTAL